MQAYLREPIESQCINDQLKDIKGIEEIRIYKNSPRTAWANAGNSYIEQDPDSYLFESSAGGGAISQARRKEGDVFWSIGTYRSPRWTHLTEADEEEQVFNAHVAMRIAEACQAKFTTSEGLACIPNSARCDVVVRSSKTQ